MKKTIRNSLKRVLAMTMALFVVFGSIPMPMVSYAMESVGEGEAQTGNNVEVSVSVTDSEETPAPIEGATVKYVLTAADAEQPVLDDPSWNDKGVTDENGALMVLPADTVDVSEATNAVLWVQVAYSSYKTEVQSFALDSATVAETLEFTLEEEVQQTNTVTVAVTGGNGGTTVKVDGKDVGLDGTGNGTSDVNASNAVVYTIIPEDGYYIKSIKVGETFIEESKLPKVGDSFEGTLDLSQSGVELTIEIEQYHTISVTVQDSNATIKVDGTELFLDTDGNGSINLAPNAEVEYIITPKADFYITGIKDGTQPVDITNVLVGDAYIGKIDLTNADASLMVSLGNCYTVSVAETTVGGEEGVGGTVKLNGNATENVTVASGEKVEVMIEAAEGYIISNVTGVSQEITDNKIFTTEVDNATSISVTFTKTYTITINYDSAQGTVGDVSNIEKESVSGKVTFTTVHDSNIEKIEITAESNTGYRVAEVQIDDENPITYTANNADFSGEIEANKDHTVTITFALNVYEINTSNSTNGTVSVNNKNVFEYDETAVITVTPDDGYTIDKIQIKGVSDAVDIIETVNVEVDDKNIPNGSYTFEINDIKEDKTIVVTFKKANAVTGAYVINATNVLRTVNESLYVIKPVSEETKIAGEIEFRTINQENFNIDGIRVYKDVDGVMELVGGDGKTSSVRVEADGDTNIVKVQVYCQPEGDICPAWHDVTTITEETPIKMVVDGDEPTITFDTQPKSNGDGYYNSNVTINVIASDKEENYSGIASIEYFITTSFEDYAKADSEYDKISASNKTNLYPNESDEIKQSVSLEELDYKIVVDAKVNNSQYTRVWIKVTDRAGNATFETIELPINSTNPMVSLLIDGEKNDGITEAYYKSDRILTFTIVDRADTFIAKEDTENKASFKFVIHKDGSDIVINGNDITWQEEEENTPNVHVGTYTLSEEGNYEIDIDLLEYTNKASLSNEGVDVIDAENAELDFFVIDKKAPEASDITITYPDDEKEPTDDRYYDDYVDVNITALDNVSGIKQIKWKYVKTEGASSVNKDSDTEYTVITCDTNETTCTKTITLPKEYDSEKGEYKQLNGYLSVIVIDWAGHETELKVDDENRKVFVVDNKLPIGSVDYTNPIQTINDTTGSNHYYNGDIDFQFNIEEANFDSNDIKVFVKKDNGEKEAIATSDIEWIHNSVDEHIGSYTISGDGDYVLYLEYEDKSGNEMTPYQTDVLTIDTGIPELAFSFDENQIMTFTVSEHNFRPKDISLDGTIRVTETDADGNLLEFTIEDLEKELQEATWVKTGDQTGNVYTYSSGDYVDGFYDLDIDYMDVALNPAQSCSPETVIIDHTAPRDVTITYSTPLLEKVLETITFGFYKADVKVTFTAYDDAIGVDYFTWNYTKENGASDINRATDAQTSEVDAVPDETDKTKFTATITLPDTAETQLRGYLAVQATDNYSNIGNKVTDAGHIVVVDSIAPTMTAEYSVADRIEGAASYYDNDVEVTFNVTEANFYADDVIVKVSKDGGAAYDVTPQWTDVNTDLHIGTSKLSGDGDYIITVNYTDCSTNEMAVYTSNVITIDTVDPVIEVDYANTNVINTLADRDGNQREYFADTQTATITIKEHNFKAEDVMIDIKATDVAGNTLDVSTLYTASEWKAGTEEDTHVLTITYPGDANYTFDVSYADLATNETTDYTPDYFTVDNTAPVNLEISYSTSILETILEFISFGFYNAKADVTIVADDVTSGVHEFVYSYTKAQGVSTANAELISQAISAAGITYSNDGKTATARFQIPKDILDENNQFNGNVSFEAIDRAGLKNTLADNKRIVVDNIAPTAQVTYNEPVNTEGTISYYNGNVNATVVVTEANFYASDVSVTVSKDGGAPYPVTPSWINNSVDLHTGTFTLSDDGDYIVTISYRDKSSNEMTVYTSEQLTIDTDIVEPTITFNGNNETGHAYKGEIIPEISFSDINYDSFEVSLYRTYMNEINVDITESKGINNLFSISEESGSATLNIFDVDADGNYDPNDDGIYRLVVTMNDKAGHTIEKEAYFTINRYGSTYAFDEYLVDLTANGGAFVSEVTSDIIITEYNADQLVTDSLSIEITRDGKPLEEVKYIVSPAINENAAVGESGWYQYEYVISKDNFVADGIYKISISSEDATGNTPENSNYEDKNITFYVDSTVPEITSITGLEESIVDDTELTISYAIFDAIGLKSIKVYVDGEILEEITDFSADFNNYQGSFTLEESEAAREIRIVVEDMAGNITDTDSEDFTSAYTFNSTVTVTTNALVRFYANKPLFYGTIGGVVGVIVLVGVVIRMRMKKKAE